jgi:flagellar assembly factor FliW
MDLSTTRFGVIQFEEEVVITMTQPIIGFQEYRRFLLLPGPPDSSVTWLQSADSGELAFLLMDPRRAVPEYQINLTQHDLAELAATSLDELSLFTLVVVPQDRTKIRTNLKAPILINEARKLGKQVVMDRSDYPIQYFLAQGQPGQGQSQKEAKHARSDA